MYYIIILASEIHINLIGGELYGIKIFSDG